MNNLNDLQVVLDNTADEIAQYEPDPRKWTAWLVYLLENLELQAMANDANHPSAYEDMLDRLLECIDEGLKPRRW